MNAPKTDLNAKVTFCILLFALQQKSKSSLQKTILKPKGTAADGLSQPSSALCPRTLRAPWSLLVWKSKSGSRTKAVGVGVSDGEGAGQRQFRTQAWYVNTDGICLELLLVCG